MDVSVFRRINGWTVATGWLHGPAAAYAKYGIVIFAVLLAVGWWRARVEGDLHRQAGVGWAAGSVFVALGVAQLIGRAVDRPRPYATLEHVHVLIARTADFSFPSDHATAVGAVAGGLWLVDRKLGPVAAAFALLMAGARVYAGVHYPSDVLVGLGLGAAVAVIGSVPASRLIELLLRQLVRSPRLSALTGRGGADGQPV